MSFQLWETLKESITSYTGLSPATFFTLIALLWAIYYVITSIFGPTDYDSARARNMHAEQVQTEPLQPPVQLGEITLDELKQYDGSDPKKPLLMAIKGQIYDVSQSRGFYGPGGAYALFAGKDASRALAKMSFEDQDLTGDLSGLGPFELDALQDWEWRFMSKYVKVGTIKTTEGTEGTPSGTPAEATNNEATVTGETVETSQQEPKPSEGATDKTE